MTADLSFQLDGWIGAALDNPLERATLGALRITSNGDVLTEVEDVVAQTVRPHIIVPGYSLAEWMLINWWRLRWESGSNQQSLDWRQAHEVASIGGGYVWPNLRIESDGEFVRLTYKLESSRDATTVRFLRGGAVTIPASSFEAALDELFDIVDRRFFGLGIDQRSWVELRDELRDERTDPVRAASCRLQARAGIDPGAAPEEWLRAAAELVAQAGQYATEELLATTPVVQEAHEAVRAMHDADTEIDVSAVATLPLPPAGRLPWERGAQLAADLRKQLQLRDGPVTNDDLERCFGLRMDQVVVARGVAGGYRHDARSVTATTTMRRPVSRRFEVVQLLAGARLAADDQHVLPITHTSTALQKLQRSFAQEFLCPWRQLESFTRDHGTDDDGIAEAADYFQVSEGVVRTTLWNKRLTPRSVDVFAS